MIRQDLKNAETYRNKLAAYAKSVGIKIKRKSMDVEGVYVPYTGVIWVDQDLEDVEEIATLLHELGHAWDDALTSMSSSARLQNAYDKIYTPHYTKHQVFLVLECEKRAWKYAKVIAKMLKIPLGKWFTKLHKEYINSYREL